MSRFAAMFVPNAAALAEGVTPASWTILTDGGASALDQVMQRASRRAAGHLGLQETVTSNLRADDAGMMGVDLHADRDDDKPIGRIVWIEAPLDLAMAA